MFIFLLLSCLLTHAMKELKKFEMLSFVPIFWLPCSLWSSSRAMDFHYSWPV